MKNDKSVPKALSYKDGMTYKQRRPVSAGGGTDPMDRVKSSKGPKVEQAFFYTGPNKTDVGMCSFIFKSHKYYFHFWCDRPISLRYLTGKLSSISN